ncbi:MAG: FMN-binding protein [Defluviitaleaceae bacterium]|nr:FMN-binding protein [Defluviitaleaceae bacterium]
MKTALPLFIITVLVTAAIAFIHGLTEERIKTNEHAAYTAALSALVIGIPDPVFSETHETGNRTGVVSYTLVTSGGEFAAVVINVRFMGDQGPASVAVAASTCGSVLGVKVTSHEETPGLGANAAGTDFLSQFTDKSGIFNVVRTANARIHTNDIIAVTAATNTSRAVADAVNEALRFASQLILKFYAEILAEG